MTDSANASHFDKLQAAIEAQIEKSYENPQYDPEHHTRIREAKEESNKDWAEKHYESPFHLSQSGWDLINNPEVQLKSLIDGIIYFGYLVMAIAAKKAGKTTLCLNLVYALLTGIPFLKKYEVTPWEGRVGYLNYEVSKQTMKESLKGMGLTEEQLGRLEHLPLRGTQFDLAAPSGTEELIAWCLEKDIKILFVDPFSMAKSPGMNENDNSTVSDWLNVLSYVHRQAGLISLILVAHAGHADNGDPLQSISARGASALEGWYDSVMYLQRDEQADGKPRWMSVDGRDNVALGPAGDKQRLVYNPDTGMLWVDPTASSGGVKGSRLADAVQARVDYVTSHEGCSQRDIIGACGNNRPALKKAIDDGSIVVRKGPNHRDLLHFTPDGALDYDVKTVAKKPSFTIDTSVSTGPNPPVGDAEDATEGAPIVRRAPRFEIK